MKRTSSFVYWLPWRFLTCSVERNSKSELLQDLRVTALIIFFSFIPFFLSSFNPFHSVSPGPETDGPGRKVKRKEMDSVAFGRKGSQDIVAPLPEWATVNKSNVTGQDMRLHTYIDLIDLGWNEFRAWHALESDLTRTWARGLKSHLSPPSFCHFL